MGLPLLLTFATPLPMGYSGHFDHSKNGINAVLALKPIEEDPVFGFRAAGTAPFGNVSYDRGQAVRWDPDALELL